MKEKTFGWRRFFLPVLLIVLGVFSIGIWSFFSTRDNANDAFQDLFNRNYSIFALKLPEKMDFAGEKVPLNYFDVRESLDKELLVNTYWQSQTLLFIKRANRYFPVIESILREHNIPDDFKYVALAESGLTNITSPAGAVGFWQFLSGTARDYGLEVTNEVDERYHLKKSTEAACLYFKESYEKYGSWTLAAASYNNGRKGLDKQISRQGQTDYYDLLLNEETGRYIFRLLAFKLILNQPEKYGFHFRVEDLYPLVPTQTVRVDSSIHSMEAFAHNLKMNYRMLKYFNPWLRETYLSNKKGKVYELEIPEKDFRSSVYSSDSVFETWKSD